MKDGIYIGTTPNGVKWICYEPATLGMMKEAFQKMCLHQVKKNKRIK